MKACPNQYEIESPSCLLYSNTLFRKPYHFLRHEIYQFIMVIINVSVPFITSMQALKYREFLFNAITKHIAC